MKISKEIEVLLALDRRKVEECTCEGAPKYCSQSTGRVFIPPERIDWDHEGYRDAQIPCEKHLHLYIEADWREYGVE